MENYASVSATYRWAATLDLMMAGGRRSNIACERADVVRRVLNRKEASMKSLLVDIVGESSVSRARLDDVWDGADDTERDRNFCS
jgi:hypothetical protein